MWIVFLMIMLLFALLGVVLYKGKGAGLIAGFNTLSQEEKAKYDEKTLCRFVGKIMFVMTGTWFLIFLGTILNREFILWTGVALFFLTALFAIAYSNTKSRFRK